MWIPRQLPVMTCVLVLIFTGGCSREHQHWKSAESADTIEAYNEFIQRHPDSELVTQARTRVAQLSEEQDWQRASSKDTAAAYQEFLTAHPNGKWAQEAHIRVENFSLGDTPPAPEAAAPVPAPTTTAAPLAPAVQETTRAAPPAPAATVQTTPKAKAAAAQAASSPSAGFGIQLGAYTTEARAKEEWQKLLGHFSAQLQPLKPRYVVGQGSSGKVYRLQAATQNEAQARTLCSQLKQKSQPCVVVLP